MKFSTLLAGAATIGVLLTGFAMADDYLGGTVKTSEIGGKEVFTDAKGMTLYTYDTDTKGSASACYDKCATAWPPLWVPASAAVSGDWSLIGRTDATGANAGMKQVAYKGWPLYTWIQDKKPGDTTGDGKGGVWHTAVEAM